MGKNIYEYIRITEDALCSLESDRAHAIDCLNKAISEGNQQEIDEYEEWLMDIGDEIQYRHEDLTELTRELEDEDYREEYGAPYDYGDDYWL